MKSRLKEVLVARWEHPYLIEAQKGQAWSYGETVSLAAEFARQMAGRGVTPGERVLLSFENGPEFVVAYLACLFGGFVAVPLAPGLSALDRNHILDTVRGSLVLAKTEGASAGGLPHLTIAMDECPAAQGPVFRALEARDEKAVFTVHFTSGTTGRPKGVCHTLEGLLRSAQAFNEALEFGPAHRFLHLLPMAYMAGFLNTLLCPLLAGASVVLDQSYHAGTPLRFWAVPRRHGVNVLWIVPSMAAAIVAIDKDAEGIGYCRNFIQRVCVGTAPLPPELRERFEQKYGVRLLESYGLSETLFVASNGPSIPVRRGSVGRVLREVKIRVVDASGAEQPRGMEGEIGIESPFVFPGYYGGTGASPEIFPSGDLGYLDEDGMLFITGRKKDLIIRGGVNVSPRAIEEALLSGSDQILAAAVLGTPHALKGEEIVAFLMVAETSSFPVVVAAMESHCREVLAPHQRPDRFVRVDRMPIGISGKIQKHKLRESFLAGA